MKNSTKKAQMRRFYECLKERPMTTKMASIKTGIQRCNLTRYVAEFEKLNIIATVKTAKCEVTHHQAKYYSTEQKYLEPEIQSSLFPTPEPPKAGAYSQ